MGTLNDEKGGKAAEPLSFKAETQAAKLNFGKQQQHQKKLRSDGAAELRATARPKHDTDLTDITDHTMNADDCFGIGLASMRVGVPISMQSVWSVSGFAVGVAFQLRGSVACPIAGLAVGVEVYRR